MTRERRVRTGAARSRASAQRERGRVVTQSSAYGDESESTDYLPEQTFPPGVEPAFVRVSAGGTYNLGNYESLRLDVSVTLPCLPSDIEAAYDTATEFVSDKIQREEASWLGRAKEPAPKKARTRQ